MSTTSNVPGWSDRLPDPAEPFGPTRWVTATPTPAAGASEWAAGDAPGGAPPVVAEGAHTRPGWLTRGRDGSGGAT